ncbi:MAG: DUF1214 domain-containing protein [Ilumatobacteraceae bacterium]
MTADAMRRFLRELEGTVEALGPFETPVEAADAHRHVLRLTSAALDLFVERADPARPMPTEWMSPTRKFLGDSPDTVYTTVPVSSAHRYRLRIGVGNALYTGMVAYGRRTSGGAVHIVDSVVDRDLMIKDGQLIVEVGPHIEPGNPSGLSIDDSTFWIMVRQYFASPFEKSGGQVVVERTDGVAPDGPPDPEAFSTGVDAAGKWIAAQARADMVLDGMMRYPEGSTAAATDPPVPPDDLVSLFFPTPDINYQGCRLMLAAGEQLRVDVVPPPCRFWSVVVSTPWLESLEHRVTHASINSERCHPNSDGSVTIVVSEHDPGVANWIPLRGYARAQVAYRVLLAENPPSDARFVVEHGGP